MDFTQGIRTEDVLEGVPLQGQVGDEAVLLVRLEGEVYAVSATCTHHGAPLGDGLLVGDEIRCPWHHACFSIRTGAVAAAPALNPLARWQVEERAGRFFVTDKLPARDPLETRDRARSTVRSVVIIGAGAAGSAAAEALRIHGHEGEITIIDPDAAAPYDRPNLSKDYLAGTAPEEWLPLRASDFYEQHGIRRLVDRATRIDATNRTVTLAGGEVVTYDALLLATGAAPIRPPIPGAELPHVHVLRTLDDAHALISAVSTGTRVVIAGASFIGMEAAAALRQRNANVTVVAPELIPFAQVLGPTIGASLMRLHQQHDVVFQLGRKLEAIRSADVLLDDGTAVPADVVLLGIGVRPVLALAESAGLKIDGGVVVNEYLETSVAGIFAAGDIARYPSRRGDRIRVEHWVVAQRQGRSAAMNILGLRKPFDEVPFFWTQQYETSVSYVGHARDFSHIQVDGTPESGDCAASFMSGDELLAYVSIGRDRESLEKESEMEAKWRT